MTAFNTLGRYMSFRFLTTVLGVFFLFMVLSFFIDFVEMLRQSGKQDNIPMSTLLTVTLTRLPVFSEITMPFAVLIGAMGTFLMLSRSSELTIIRASGISVWQFLQPGLSVALVLGILAITLYNPFAAASKAYSEKLYAESFGASKTALSSGTGVWVHQDSVDGPSILHAQAVADQGQSLAGVTLLQFDASKKFVERIEARKGTLKDGYWQLENGAVSDVDGKTQPFKVYLSSTTLTASQVGETIGSVESLSFWELPKYIARSEKSDLAAHSAGRYKLYYQMLLAKPLLLAAMTLVAATCSLRAFRFGRIQTMVIAGLSAGFGFYVFSELSRKLGAAGMVPVSVSAWMPIVIAILIAVTMLLHQEDG
jgi:lipopolysaccharide export system permease protein